MAAGAGPPAADEIAEIRYQTSRSTQSTNKAGDRKTKPDKEKMMSKVRIMLFVFP
jgi:hypothetical protein